MTQPGGFAHSDDALRPQSAADDGQPASPAASQEASVPAAPARLRRKAVVIAVAAVLGLVLFGSGVGTGMAISGTRTGPAAGGRNTGSGRAFRLPAKLLGLDRNTYTRSDSSGWPTALIAHTVSGTYGAALPNTRTISVAGGTLTPAAQTEARIAPADMALSELQFPGSTDAQKFPGGRRSAGVACAHWSEPSFGPVIVCFSVDQTTLFEAIYGWAASSLQDAAAETVQIRSVLER